MGQTLLGVAAFAMALAFDWASWRRLSGLKPLLGLAATMTFGAALVWTLMTPGRYDWPGWLVALGWAPTVVGGTLLVYSLFLELPFAYTYAHAASGDELVKTGTYALVRHPGVLWFGVWMTGCVLVSRSRLLLRAGAVWWAADIVLVWLQEALFFERMLPGYAAYRRETPMLVPTRQSVARCWRTLRWRQQPPG